MCTLGPTLGLSSDAQDPGSGVWLSGLVGTQWNFCNLDVSSELRSALEGRPEFSGTPEQDLTFRLGDTFLGVGEGGSLLLKEHFQLQAVSPLLTVSAAW